jgi:hypothetical protein
MSTFFRPNLDVRVPASNPLPICAMACIEAVIRKCEKLMMNHDREKCRTHQTKPFDLQSM